MSVFSGLRGFVLRNAAFHKDEKRLVLVDVSWTEGLPYLSLLDDVVRVTTGEACTLKEVHDVVLPAETNKQTL